MRRQKSQSVKGCSSDMSWCNFRPMNRKLLQKHTKHRRSWIKCNRSDRNRDKQRIAPRHWLSPCWYCSCIIIMLVQDQQQLSNHSVVMSEFQCGGKRKDIKNSSVTNGKHLKCLLKPLAGPGTIFVQYTYIQYNNYIINLCLLLAKIGLLTVVS